MLELAVLALLVFYAARWLLREQPEAQYLPTASAQSTAWCLPTAGGRARVDPEGYHDPPVVAAHSLDPFVCTSPWFKPDAQISVILSEGERGVLDNSDLNELLAQAAEIK